MTTRRSLVRFFAVLLLLPLFGQACKNSAATRQASQPISLSIWGVFDTEDAFAPLMSAYRVNHPNIQVSYRKFRAEEYERELVNALAEDRGPDIFMVRNTSMPQYLSKAEPLPTTITLPYVFEKGTLKKEKVVEMRTTRSLTPTEVSRNFLDIVYKDAVFPVRVSQETGATEQRVFGLPLAVDTLALFYNKDIYNASGVSVPPATWDDFGTVVKQITRVNPEGGIVQSAAAIGTARNVERSTDILSAIMMQAGAPMTDDVGNPTFNKRPDTYTGAFSPAYDALVFYTAMADPSRDLYTWNATQTGSFEAFATGKTAMFFGYTYHIPLLRARAPKLNYDVASLPQIAGNPVVNYGNYWLMTTSKKSKNIPAAWDFIQFATRAENVPAYLSATGKPTALKALVSTQTEIPALAPFAKQLLTARSWYRGEDVVAAENALMELIETSPGAADENRRLQLISTAAVRVGQTR